MADHIVTVLMVALLAACTAAGIIVSAEHIWDLRSSKVQFERLKNALEKERDQ